MPSPSPSVAGDGAAQGGPAGAPSGVRRVGSVRALRAASASSRTRAPMEAVSSIVGPGPELAFESWQAPSMVKASVALRAQEISHCIPRYSPRYACDQGRQFRGAGLHAEQRDDAPVDIFSSSGSRKPVLTIRCLTCIVSD